MIFPLVHAIFTLACALTSLSPPPVAANPIPLDPPPPPTTTRTQNASSSSLLATLPPWGPDDFHVFAVEQTTRIRRPAAFMTALGLLAQQAHLDFYGRLAQPQIIFRDPSFSPALSIWVAAPGPDQRVA
ncbi:MAG: hypothetical protein Q9184_007760, partial [Pyrenodesmia sp. 2 TL-2023]